jgi:ABC-type phosphate transport system substrate-binding protein
MWKDCSNMDNKSKAHIIPVAAIGVGRAIVAALIAGGVLWLSAEGNSDANLAALTTSSQHPESPTPSPSGTGPTSIPNSPTECTTGSLLLIGSTAFTPIAQGAADAFQQACPQATILVNTVSQATAAKYQQACPYLSISVNSVKGADSAFGLTQVQDAVARHCQYAGSMIAMYDGVYDGTAGLSQHPMGALIFSVVAHRGLYPQSNISHDELYKIFDKLGEPDKVAVGRRAGSGSRKAFFANVLNVNPAPAPYGHGCPPPAGATSCTEDSTADLLDFVNKTSNAIGYAEVNEPSSTDLQVSQLAIDGVTPTADNVSNGRYHFWAIEHLYSAMLPSMLATDFLTFLREYLASYPAADFAACSYSPRLAAACNPATQTPTAPTPAISTTPSVTSSHGSSSLATGWSIPVAILLILVCLILFYLVHRRHMLRHP